MGGRSSIGKSTTKPVLPHDIEVQVTAPPPQLMGEHTTLENTPGARNRLREPSNPPKDTEPHEIETAEWLSERRIKFKWFQRYKKDRTSPDVFIGDKSVDMKALFPANGEFNEATYNNRVRSGIRQSRRLLVDATRTDLPEPLAVKMVTDTISDIGMYLDEFVILIRVGVEKIAIGWHRA
jgi:hypothetical protein